MASKHNWMDEEGTSSSPMGMKAENYAREAVRKFYHSTSLDMKDFVCKIEEASRKEFEASGHAHEENEDTFWLSDPSSTRTRFTQFHISVEFY